MSDVPQIKNEMRMALSIIQDGVKYFCEQNNSFCEDQCDVSGEVGETIEEKELKKWEKEWSREWVCPICGENIVSDVFIRPVLKVENGDTVFGKQGGIVSDAQKSDFDGEDNTRKERFAFESEEAFDNHMKDVHGIEIDKTKDMIADDILIRQFGAHYSDMRYGKQMKNPKKSKEAIKRLE